MPSPSSTFPQTLQRALQHNPGRPLVTAYDEAAGWRTELSVATYANWVNKTANLLTDEYLLGEGDALLIDVGSHWLATVFAGAAWSAGISVTIDAEVGAQLIVTGPPIEDDLTAIPVLASTLNSFATAFPDDLPDGVDDFGTLWPNQPDVFMPSAQLDAATLAWRHRSGSATQQDLLNRAREVARKRTGTRLLTASNPLIDGAVGTLLAALVSGGSVVTVAHPTDDAWVTRYNSERPTDLG